MLSSPCLGVQMVLRDVNIKIVAIRWGYRMAYLAAIGIPNSLYRVHFLHLFLACALCCSFIFVVFVFCFLSCSRWSFVDDVPLIFSCPADHVLLPVIYPTTWISRQKTRLVTVHA